MANTIHAKSGDIVKIIDNNDGDWVDIHQVYYVEAVFDEDREQGSKCFKFRNVDESWWGCPHHYEICNAIDNNKADLVEEAARRYPKGTHYLEVGSGFFGAKYESRASDVRIFDHNHTGPRIMVDGGQGLVYMNGVWAPIVHSSYQTFQKYDTVVRWRDIEDWEWKAIGDIPCPSIGEPLEISKVHASNGLDKVPSIELGHLGWFPATAFIFSEYYNQSITNRGTAEHLNESDHVKSKISTGISIEVQRPIASIVTGQRRTGSRIQGRGDAAVIGRGHLSHKTITGK